MKYSYDITPPQIRFRWTNMPEWTTVEPMATTTYKKELPMTTATNEKLAVTLPDYDKDTHEVEEVEAEQVKKGDDVYLNLSGDPRRWAKVIKITSGKIEGDGFSTLYRFVTDYGYAGRASSEKVWIRRTKKPDIDVVRGAHGPEMVRVEMWNRVGVITAVEFRPEWKHKANPAAWSSTTCALWAYAKSQGWLDELREDS